MQSLKEYHRNERIKIENATFYYGMLHFVLHYIFRLTMGKL